jgi:hypothetical protein
MFETRLDIDWMIRCLSRSNIGVPDLFRVINQRDQDLVDVYQEIFWSINPDHAPGPPQFDDTLHYAESDTLGMQNLITYIHS